jgi:hypothetical protein
MDKQKKVDEILDSLNGCTPATAPGFFYTRLKARMEKTESGSTALRQPWVLKPAYAMAAAFAVLVLNAFILFQNGRTSYAVTSADTDTFQSVAADYSLNDNNTLFDLTEDRQP